MRILDLIFPPREDERIIRDLPADAFLARMRPQTVPATRPETMALFSLADPAVRAVIHEAKYHGSARAFSLLAESLADFLPDLLADRFEAHRAIIVPVPLGALRQRERGFNQVEEAARRAVKVLAADIRLDPTLLVRTRETPTQISLGREARVRNMRSAFRAQGLLDPSYTYIVLDDVITTGATLGAAIEALVANGLPEESIQPLAFSH